jgi:hypothetical protein
MEAGFCICGRSFSNLRKFSYLFSLLCHELFKKGSSARRLYDRGALVFSLTSPSLTPIYFHIGYGDLKTLRFELHKLVEEHGTFFSERAKNLGHLPLQSVGVPAGIANTWSSFKDIDFASQWHITFYRLWSSSLHVVDFKPSHVVVSKLALGPRLIWRGLGSESRA